MRQQQLISLVDQRTAELQGEIVVRKQTEEELKQARDQAFRLEMNSTFMPAMTP